MFTEIPNKKALDYLKSLSKKQILDLLNVGNKKSEDFQYVDRIINYCKLSNKKGFNKVKYNQKDGKGRYYPNKLAFASLQKDFRGLLCRDDYQDIDMINSLPSILLNRCPPNISTNYLSKYITDRDSVLKMLNCTKKTFLINYITTDYNGDIRNGQLTDFGKAFLSEMTIIKDYFYKNYKEVYARNDYSGDNPKSSVLTNYIYDIENEILQLVISKFPKKSITSLACDGFISPKEIVIDIDKINRITSSYGVKWSKKEFSNKIQIPNNYKTTILSLEESKDRFEKNHFIIRNPFCYVCEEANGQLNKTSDKQKFVALSSQFYNVNFHLDDFLSHPNRREYSHFVNTPFVLPKELNEIAKKNNCYYLEKDNENSTTFNTSKPYNSVYISHENRNDDYNHNALDFCIEFIKTNICSNKNDDWKWLLNFIIYKIKNPHLLLGVGIVIKGQMGSGKDTLLEILNRIYGEDRDYIYNQQDVTPILSSTNTGLLNKQIIVLNEMKSITGVNYMENLKDVITRKKNNIKELYKDPYLVDNTTTLFVLSNNQNPIRLCHSNRRWVLLVTSDINVGKTEYWTNIYKIIEDDHFINCLFTQIIEYEIPSDFNPRDITKQPRNQDYYDSISQQIDPIFKFVYNLDFSDISIPIHCEKSKWNGFYYCNKTKFKELFNKWTGDSTKIQTQKISNKLIEIKNGVYTDISININGKKYNNMILLNKPIILDYLKVKYFHNVEETEDIVILKQNSLDLNVDY